MPGYLRKEIIQGTLVCFCIIIYLLSFHNIVCINRWIKSHCVYEDTLGILVEMLYIGHMKVWRSIFRFLRIFPTGFHVDNVDWYFLCLIFSLDCNLITIFLPSHSFQILLCYLHIHSFLFFPNHYYMNICDVLFKDELKIILQSIHGDL